MSTERYQDDYNKRDCFDHNGHCCNNNCYPTNCNWCDPNGDFCNYKPNCSPKCCTPLECGPANIENARCIPIMADKIFDCICLDNIQYGAATTIGTAAVQITIENYNPDTMISGMPICIDRISTHFDAIGVTVPSLPFNVGSQTGVPFSPLNGSSTVATDFKAVLNSPSSCCPEGLGTRTKISNVDPIVFEGVNGRVSLTGRIGYLCFRGTLVFDNPLVINGNLPGIYPLNIFSKICLPSEQRSVNLNLSFTPVLDIECITPLSPYTLTEDGGVATFNASIEYSFAVKTEISSSTVERLGVFASNNEIHCRDNCHRLCDK